MQAAPASIPRMGGQMELSFVGPMPVRQFFRKFLPAPISFPKVKRIKLPGFETMSIDGSGNRMYDQFTTAVNSVCSTVKAYNASKNSATERDAKHKPDVTLYDACKSPPEALIPCFQHMELFVDFGCESTSDPFDGEDSASRRSFHPITTSPGRMALHSTRLQMYQFRTFVFSVGVFGDVARLFRWDRSGAIVSGPILYGDTGNRELAEFFYRFDLADRGGRGWDLTVSDATPKEIAAFDRAVRIGVGRGKDRPLEKLLGSVGDGAKHSRKKVDIIRSPGGQTSYIVGRSKVTPDYPAGRCTRGFVAMDVKAQQLVFLKDCWRQNTPGLKSESHWHEILRGARNIAAFSHGSDVGCVVPRQGVRTRGMRGTKPHLTLTQNYAKKYRNTEATVGYVHYRTVQGKFYVPLHTFRDSRHLAEIMHDVLLAMEDLFERGILHRDISDGNIMITVDGRGCLIDLDFAREVNYSGPHRRTCVGTLPFMSTQLLLMPGKIHELSDDLESHFFVMLHTALHFVKHNRPSDLNMKFIFDEVAISQGTGTHCGGERKAYMYRRGLRVKFSCKPITILFRKLLKLFKSLKDYHEHRNSENDPPKSVVKEVEKLKDCAEIRKLFVEALESNGWPAQCDKVEDQYPSSRSTSQRMESVGLTYVDRDPTMEPANKKWKRGEDGPPRPKRRRKKQ